MSYLAHAQAVTDIDDLVVTHELASRPPRAPDHAAENRVLAALAQLLARDPEQVPGRVAGILRELCRCEAAGTSLPDQWGGRAGWRAAGGEPVLLRDPARLFPSLGAAGTAPAEMLLLPSSLDGGATGVLWVAGAQGRFDAEDLRLLRSLSDFAAAAQRLAGETAQRSAAEAASRESDGRFRALADASPAVVFQFDEDAAVSYANRQCQHLLGMQAGATPDDGWGALLHPDDGPGYVARVRSAIAERTSFQQRVRARAADGRWHCFESHGAPLFGAGGAYHGHVGIAIDVTRTVRAEEALRNADRRKDEFLATLAHELRNPLAPISNAVHLLRRPDGRRTADRMVEMVGRQVRQMVRLVDDLMDVSRITQGKLELRREPLSLAEVLAVAVETSMPAIEAGRHELTVSLPDETLMLEADKVRLTQVFGNLLNNAARYTDRGGRIWLGARHQDGQVAVSVRDSGIGIPAAKLPHVFEMFSQAHRDSARGQAGLGIGLTMVRSLVELHGGWVEARSEGPGRGSEFIVRLPLAQLADAPAHGDEGSGDAPLEGRRVLVVDDNADAAESLALLLQSVGADVHTAGDGPAGLEAARRFAPHAVLLDLGMPGMDGFEVARRLRAEPGLAGLVLVALTGWGQEEDRRRTRSSGFDHHLTKPVDLDRLMDILVKIRPGAGARVL